MTLTLAVDLDGVLADYCAAMAAEGGLTVEGDPPTYGMVGGDWFPDREAWMAAHYEVSSKYRSLPLVEADSPEVLGELSAAGLDILYATARQEVPGVSLEDIHEASCGWLADHGFPNPDRVFVGSIKTDVAFDVLVDDSTWHLADAYRAGRKRVAFDREYNRNAPCDLRVSSVHELRALLRW